MSFANMALFLATRSSRFISYGVNVAAPLMIYASIFVLLAVMIETLKV